MRPNMGIFTYTLNAGGEGAGGHIRRQLYLFLTYISLSYINYILHLTTDMCLITRFTHDVSSKLILAVDVK